MLRQVSRRERIDHDLLRRYRDEGDLQAREHLAERLLPLVRSIARHHAGDGREMDDLIQAGLLGLTKAIERFDMFSGGRFVAYAIPSIRGEIFRYLRDCTWAVHVPRSLKELDVRVRRAGAEMRQQTGCRAGTRDLALVLRVGPEDVRQAQAVGRSRRAVSLDQPAVPGAAAGRVGGDVDPGFDRVENADVIERAMAGLGDRDRLVVWWRFRDGMLQREIAERIGVSQMQVSRILKSALERMGEGARDGQGTPANAGGPVPAGDGAPAEGVSP